MSELKQTADVESDPPPNDAPHCDTCGAELTTGLMAAFCPRRERCEFWPEDATGMNFIRWVKGEIDSPDAT